jgi:hypothetical protein
LYPQSVLQHLGTFVNFRQSKVLLPQTAEIEVGYRGFAMAIARRIIQGYLYGCKREEITTRRRRRDGVTEKIARPLISLLCLNGQRTLQKFQATF